MGKAVPNAVQNLHGAGLTHRLVSGGGNYAKAPRPHNGSVRAAESAIAAG